MITTTIDQLISDGILVVEKTQLQEFLSYEVHGNYMLTTEAGERIVSAQLMYDGIGRKALGYVYTEGEGEPTIVDRKAPMAVRLFKEV